ncbi:unnamed protein product, partial [Rotaria sp. Silwood2]
MVLFPITDLRRVLLLVIIILSYLIINLVSFRGNSSIKYVAFPIRFGFIQSSQSLEIIYLIVNVFADLIIILEIINLDRLQFDIMFLPSALLLSMF